MVRLILEDQQEDRGHRPHEDCPPRHLTYAKRYDNAEASSRTTLSLATSKIENNCIASLSCIYVFKSH